MDVPDLEPDVRVGEGIWGTLKNLLEAAEALLVLATLLIDYTQPKEDFVGLVKVQIWKEPDQLGCTFVGERTHTFVHPENRSKSFFGMIQGSVAIIEDTDTVPQLRIILERDVSHGKEW